MKVEIDLNQLMGDDFESETVQDSIRRQLVEHLGSCFDYKIRSEIEAEVRKLIQQRVATLCEEHLGGLFSQALDSSFSEVDDWDCPTGQTKTLRTIIKETALNYLATAKEK